MKIARIAFAFALVACTKKAPPGESTHEVCTLANKGHEVHAAGYLMAPILVGCDKKDCQLQLTPSRKEPYDLSVRLPLGSGPSTMTPLPPAKPSPVGITAEQVSVSIRDAKGGDVYVGDFVRVTGPLDVRESDGKLDCTLDVTKIESL